MTVGAHPTLASTIQNSTELQTVAATHAPRRVRTSRFGARRDRAPSTARPRSASPPRRPRIPRPGIVSSSVEGEASGESVSFSVGRLSLDSERPTRRRKTHTPPPLVEEETRRGLLPPYSAAMCVSFSTRIYGAFPVRFVRSMSVLMSHVTSANRLRSLSTLASTLVSTTWTLECASRTSSQSQAQFSANSVCERMYHFETGISVVSSPI